ncbi:MAG: GAF domain-containing protein, partial [Bacteroidota bacterium]
AISIPLLNYFRLTTTSRIITAIFGCLIVGANHGFMVKEGGSPLVACIVFDISFSLMPFIVFDLKEKLKLIFSTVFCLVFTSLYQWRIDFFEVEHSITLFENPEVIRLSIALVVLQLSLQVYFLKVFIQRAAHEQENLLQEVNERNKKLKTSEKELKESLKSIDKNKNIEQQQIWVTEGVRDIAKILRSDDNSQEIYDRILSNIVVYIGANQGALYIIDQKSDKNTQETATIKMASCYAYNRKKFIEQTFEPGEGLLGQCYYDKSIMLLTEIPEDYVDITSGLGQATPKCLVIVPLKLNDDIAGFLEIASFNIISEFQLKFLERVSENIASSIINNRTKDKTALLLSRAQEQTEMMRAQEEEMRYHFEELQATQSDMSKMQDELTSVKEHLEKEVAAKQQEIDTYKQEIAQLKSEKP